MEIAKFREVRSPIRLNELTKILARVITSAITPHTPFFYPILSLLWPQILLASQDKTVEPNFTRFALYDVNSGLLHSYSNKNSETVHFPNFYPKTAQKWA